jgi:hypothetical protein
VYAGVHEVNDLTNSTGIGGTGQRSLHCRMASVFERVGGWNASGLEQRCVYIRLTRVAGGNLLELEGDQSPVMFASFYSHGEFAVASGGRFHIKFWTLDGRRLNSKYPILPPTQSQLGTALCGGALGARFLCGTTTGHVFVWQGRTLDRVIRAHEQAVTAMHTTKIGALTAGKEGSVKLWSDGLEHLKTFFLEEAFVQPLQKSIRSVHAGLSDDGQSIIRILVGTASCEVYEIATKSGNISIVQVCNRAWSKCTHQYYDRKHTTKASCGA